MCPRFNPVFEETPREFLYQERKNKPGGEGCLSNWSDWASEWVRDRRTETESSLPRTVGSMLTTFGCVIFPHSGHVPAASTVSLFCMHRPSRPGFSLALAFSSFPSPFTLLPSPLPPSTSVLCICINAFDYVSCSVSTAQCVCVTRVLGASVYGPSSDKMLPYMLLAVLSCLATVYIQTSHI